MIVDNMTILKLVELRENFDSYSKNQFDDIIMVIYGKTINDLLNLVKKGHIVI